MIHPSCASARMELWRISFLRKSNTRNATNIQCLRLRFPSSHVTRRCNSSKPPLAQKVPPTAQTIPIPSLLWLEPIYEPFRAYGRVQQRKPYMTQFISSLVIYFVGDLVAQSIAQPAVEEDRVIEKDAEEEKGWLQQWSDDRDWHRTGRAIIIGGVSSIPAYKWFLWLGNNFNYSSKILSLTTKVAVNQALFTPIFNSYFFGMQSLLSGATVPECIERIKNTVPTSWINSCKVWPVVTAFSFTYIPIQYRSIFGGVIAIGWQTYLSFLNQKAAALEKREQEAAQDMLKVKGAVEDRNARQEEKQKCAA